MGILAEFATLNINVVFTPKLIYVSKMGLLKALLFILFKYQTLKPVAFKPGSGLRRFTSATALSPGPCPGPGCRSGNSKPRTTREGVQVESTVYPYQYQTLKPGSALKPGSNLVCTSSSALYNTHRGTLYKYSQLGPHHGAEGGEPPPRCRAVQIDII